MTTQENNNDTNTTLQFAQLFHVHNNNNNNDDDHAHAHATGMQRMNEAVERVLRMLIRGIIVSTGHGDVSEDIIKAYIRDGLEKRMKQYMSTFLRSVHAWTRLSEMESFSSMVHDLRTNLPLHGARFSDSVQSMLALIAGMLLGNKKHAPFKNVFYPEHRNTKLMVSSLHTHPIGKESLVALAEMTAAFLLGQKHPENYDGIDYQRGVLQAVMTMGIVPMQLHPDDEWSNMPMVPQGTHDDDSIEPAETETETATTGAAMAAMLGPVGPPPLPQALAVPAEMQFSTP